MSILAPSQEQTGYSRNQDLVMCSLTSQKSTQHHISASSPTQHRKVHHLSATMKDFWHSLLSTSQPLFSCPSSGTPCAIAGAGWGLIYYQPEVMVFEGQVSLPEAFPGATGPSHRMKQETGIRNQFQSTLILLAIFQGPGMFHELLVGFSAWWIRSP